MTPSLYNSRTLAWIVVGLCLVDAARGATPEFEHRLRQQFEHQRLMFCFQGKGSCLPYDAGVLEEAYSRIDALRNQQVIVAGNSSGSVLAAYFSCFGFTDRSVAYAKHQLLHGNKEAIRQMEQPGTKVVKLMANQRTEIDHAVLRETIAFALGVADWRTAGSVDEIARRSEVVPRFPVLIVAANREALDNQSPHDRLSARGHKEFNPANWDVSWTEEAFDFYGRHPRQFRKDYPDLVLGGNRRIGKAVTYFVDQTMFDLLSQVSSEERLGDLRLMTSARDLALAIMASASEPTYFDPVVEPDPGKLMTDDRLGDMGTSLRRTYCGGYVMSMMAQDVRRMLPAVRVLGTGWVRSPQPARGVLKTWYLADVQTLARQTSWWADMEINPDARFARQMIARELTARQEFEYAKALAARCLEQDRALPTFVSRPTFDYACRAAIVPATSNASPVSITTTGSTPLPTLRGLGPLLSQPNDPQETLLADR